MNFRTNDIVIDKSFSIAGRVLFCFGNILYIYTNNRHRTVRSCDYVLIERNETKKKNRFKH